MRSSFRAVLTAVVATGLTVATALPAQAHTNVCSGSGEIITAQPMYYPSGPMVFTAFTMYFPLSGTCTSTPNPETFSGQMGYYCGGAQGSGNSTSGHSFTVAWSGTQLTFAGRVDGHLTIREESGSCLTGATHFVITGALTLAN